MASRTDFTDEEWELLLEGPPSAGLMVVMSDRGGTFRESYSMAKAYTEARKEPGHSQLIDEIVEAKPDVDHTRHGSREELDSAVLQKLTDAVALLEEKATPEDVEQYKAFCWSMAEHVANARREGFLGLHGERVSDEEQAALEQIRATLGLS